jgi:CRISPR-associated protein Cas2
MDYFIAYDISDDRLRTRLAKDLERRGFHRLQQSVFFIREPKEGEWREAKAALRAWMEESEEGDSLAIIPTEDSRTGGVEVLGEKPEFQRLLEQRKSWFF